MGKSSSNRGKVHSPALFGAPTQWSRDIIDMMPHTPKKHDKMIGMGIIIAHPCKKWVKMAFKLMRYGSTH